MPIQASRLKRQIRRILEAEGVSAAEITVVFVGAQKIRALNRRFLRRDYATDVLAFDTRDPRAGRGVVQGDIVISTDAARKNARVFGNDPRRELTLYVIHGVLHLLGYDDHAPNDIRRMRAREEALMKELGV